MKKPTRRTIRSGLLTLLLLSAMFGALNSSGTFTKLAFAQNYGGGSWSCPDPYTCGNFGCHERSYLDHTQVCSRYPLNGGSCPSPINCEGHN
jgi:hypothetical protein